jgi:DNA-binding CsgD family transcriptional regulator
VGTGGVGPGRGSPYEEWHDTVLHQARPGMGLGVFRDVPTERVNARELAKLGRAPTLAPDNGDVPPARNPLVLERAGKRLVVRLAEERAEEGCILILEEQPLQLAASSFEPLGLTRREAQVLLWVARGKSEKEVTTLLYVSPHTVKKHLEHVYEKLGVKSRTEAVALALRSSGLADLATDRCPGSAP